MDIKRVIAQVDAFQQRHRPTAFLYGVVKKFGEDDSSNLAVLITYYLFFSIFPLLLALSSILGFILRHHASWKKKVNSTALSQFPFFNGHLPQHGSVALVVIGVILAIYSGLGVAKAAQNAWDIVYNVPRVDRPGFVPKNLRALRLIMIGGVSIIATTVATSIVASAGAVGIHLGKLLSVLSYLVVLGINALTFAVIFRWLTVRKLSLRDVLPGAVVFAVLLAALQAASTAIIAHKVKGADATYGTFGTVIILLSQFYLQCQVLLYCAQINIVKQDHLWPRSILTPPEDVPEV